MLLVEEDLLRTTGLSSELPNKSSTSSHYGPLEMGGVKGQWVGLRANGWG